MPVIIPPIEYDRWLSTLDPDPMTLWPVSTRVNKPTNDDASILNLLKPQVGEVSLQSLPLDVGVD